ncbi:MAG: glycosyltransferase family 4 protein [Nitrososphaerota archaeon]|nr:glycosyltransferase family 4 protein [Nitrososphaerota archaeon]
MKLLFIVSHYYPYIGGVEYVVKSVAERLVDRGHSVTVLCGDPGIDNPREETINRVSTIRWPVWSPGDAYHIPRMRSNLKRWLLESVKDYDVIHFHSVHSILTMYSLEVLKGFSVRKILTPYYHGTGHTFFRKILWRSWRSYIRKLLRFIAAVHTVSRLEAQLVKRDFKVYATPIENGVDEWVLGLDWSPSGYAMYSGRIEKYKNIHRLANIVKILNTEYGFDLELKVYGSGHYIKKLNNHLNKLKIKYSVNPPQIFEKYIETLSRATFFGLLSEKESYPQSVNEANAIGVPTVIAEPWGLNFRDRSRTLIVNLSMDDEVIARDVVFFLENCKKQSKYNVPSWDQVVEVYIRELYDGG